jgi:hypothetical protein
MNKYKIVWLPRSKNGLAGCILAAFSLAMLALGVSLILWIHPAPPLSMIAPFLLAMATVLAVIATVLAATSIKQAKDRAVLVYLTLVEGLLYLVAAVLIIGFFIFLAISWLTS